MKFGVYLPNFGEYGDPNVLVELALAAEEAGWDGFFPWDHIRWQDQAIPIADPWIALAAIAARTNRICMGPMVTPLPRRRPWKVARESVTLDHLSHGRLILGIGAGGASDAEFAAFGDSVELKERAVEMEEGLQILAGLWQGEPFQFDGGHYQLKPMQFLPRPVQTPRIPIWLAATWSEKRATVRRAAKWDGIFPMVPGGAAMTPVQVRELLGYIKTYRSSDAPFDVVIRNRSGQDAAEDAARVRDYAAAGVTWWQEAFSPSRFPLAETFARIRQGPPGLG